jgi:hypothetical protein
MSKRLAVIALAGFVGLLAACSDVAPDDIETLPQPSSRSAINTPVKLVPVGPLPPVSTGEPASWVYWLSDVDLSAVAGVSPEAAVIDRSVDYVSDRNDVASA